MATIHLPPDFRKFLQLLNAHGVEYLVVGGYAVGFYGYPRATGDMDVWIASHLGNVQGLIGVLREFGFPVPEQPPEAFLTAGQFIRLAVPPLRMEILPDIDGVGFQECYDVRRREIIDGVEVSFTSLPHRFLPAGG